MDPFDPGQHCCLEGFPNNYIVKNRNIWHHKKTRCFFHVFSRKVLKISWPKAAKLRTAKLRKRNILPPLCVMPEFFWPLMEMQAVCDHGHGQ